MPKRKKAAEKGPDRTSDVEFSPVLLKSDVEKPADSEAETGCPSVIHYGFQQAVEKKQVKKCDILWPEGKKRTFWGIYTGRTGVFRNYPHPCLKVLEMGNSFPQPYWKCGKSGANQDQPVKKRCRQLR